MFYPICTTCGSEQSLFLPKSLLFLQRPLSYVIPFAVLDGRNFLASGGGDGSVQYEFEATYYYPLTNNIALLPAFYVIGNPNNFSDNPTIYVGNLRTQFAF